MGKTATLEGPTLAWARERFREHYQQAAIDAPPRLNRREFARFPFGMAGTMHRHIAYRSLEELRSSLVREPPRHAYYSSAYYARPDNPQMNDKEWLGADLIFDLDADHLRQAGSLGYAEQLRLVRERTRSLLDDFLFGDFGIDPSQTLLVFSGGRGYHVHVRDPAYLGLTSAERRELVEYILGIGVDGRLAIEERTLAPVDAFVEASTEELPAASRRGRAYRRLAPPDAPGWRGRLSRALLARLARWEEEGAGVAQAELEAAGQSRAQARKLARALTEGGRAAQIRASLSLDVFQGQLPEELAHVLLEQARVEVQGETDAPVTTDIHRLIRLPGSLHGGTGFRVRPVAFDELASFDPFRSATVPDRGPVEVRLVADVDYPFPERVRGGPGETLELPTAAALFLTTRGEAVLPGGPE